MSRTILFILVAFLLVQCSFDGMFMHPYELTKEKISQKFFDLSLNDTMRVVTDTAFNPIFTTKEGNAYVYPFTVRNVFFKNSKGNQLQGWIFKAKKENKMAVLFLHGNAGNILSHFTIAKPLVERGCNVFIFDYAGFGYSEGKARRKQLPDDANAALKLFLISEETRGKKIIIYGQSLGGHLAVTVAKNNQEKIDGLVIEGAFTNHDEIGAYAFKPGFIAKMMIREFYDGMKSIKEYKKPLLVIHSINDEVIPYFMGEKLYQKANSPKQFYKLDKCHVCGPIYNCDSIVSRMNKMIE